jgi:5-methylcytosine-specific restriction endonuclease McrA
MQLTREEHEIYNRAVARAKNFLTAEAEMLDSIVEIDRAKLYLKFKEEFLTPFCVKHFCISEEVAATLVRVARKSLVVPELKLAVDEGRLDLTKAKTIASVVTPDNVQEWTEKAATLSKAKLEYEVAKENPKAAKKEKVKAVGADRFRLECELSEAATQRFAKVRDLVSQSQGKSASVAETIEAMMDVYLQYRDPVEKAKRAEARKTATRKDTDRSQERSTGRFIPAAELHIVNLRDQRKCQQRMPDGSICGKTRWVQIHHIVELAKGGSNKAENLITLCSHHHRLKHQQMNEPRAPGPHARARPKFSTPEHEVQ